MKMMRQLEEDYQCAGLLEPSPIYMFSNVNNGLPKKRCFEDMMAEADNILDMFHGSAIASLTFIVLYLLTSAIVLLYRMYASCSWCFKKKDQTGKKYE